MAAVSKMAARLLISIIQDSSSFIPLVFDLKQMHFVLCGAMTCLFFPSRKLFFPSVNSEIQEEEEENSWRL